MLLFNLIISILLFGFSCCICIMGLNIPIGLANSFLVGAGAFPVIMGVILMLLSLWWFVDTVLEMRKAAKTRDDKEPRVPVLEQIFGEKKMQINLLITCLFIILYIFVLIPVCGNISREYGFVMASFLFLSATIKVFNKSSWLKTMLIAAATAVIIFVVFHHGLSVVMPT